MLSWHDIGASRVLCDSSVDYGRRQVVEVPSERTHARTHLDEADDLLDLVELVVELVHDLQRLLPALLVHLRISRVGLDWVGFD